MTEFLTRGAASALALIVATGSAQADLSGMDVWADWKAYMSSTGYELSASESQSGSTLNISDVTMKMVIPDVPGDVTMSMPGFQFVENGDGSVTINMPAALPITIAFDGGPESGQGVLNVVQTGHSMRVTGDAKNMDYAYAADSVTMSLGEITANGETMPEGLFRVAVTMNSVASSTQMRLANLRNYAQSITAGNLVYDIAFDDPTSSDQGAFKADFRDLNMQAVTSLPPNMQPDDMLAMVKDGLSVNGAFTFSGGQTEMNFKADGDDVAYSSQSEGGKLNVVLDDTQLSYELGQNATAINVITQELPFPIALHMARAGFKFRMPVVKSDAEQDFAFGLTLGDFKMSDMLWSLFDAGSVLPRDPATIAMDLSGKVKLFVEMLDPLDMARMEQTGAMPGEIHALTLNSLRVALAGAELTGMGDFTFDNSDLQTFGGVPRPAGAVDLKLVGGNGLLDKIVQMGFISNQDAMGARMMMGMLAVPGEGPDTLNSRIEINDQGHVLANGQRIQ